jgi:DNA-binding transcriptional regulator YiaG
MSTLGFYFPLLSVIRESEFCTMWSFKTKLESLSIDISKFPMGSEYVKDVYEIFFLLDKHFNECEIPDVTQKVNSIIGRCIQKKWNKQHPIPVYSFEYDNDSFGFSDSTRSLYLGGEISRETAIKTLESIAKCINEREILQQMRQDAERNDQENKETDYIPVKYVTLDFSTTLSKARNAKGWKQSDLAGKMNVPLSDVKNWENVQSKARPKPVQIQKLNRLLSVTLPSL